jgi:endonuclease/exonuclease/phosphatase family metal-dependent hydrolase
MRFLLYNIRYGTGGKRPLVPWGGYLSQTRKTIENIATFIHNADPDVVGLVEVDSGSFRSHLKQNQAEIIAKRLGHYNTFASKYGDESLLGRLPLMNKQCNAFLSRDNIVNTHFHYFEHGLKKLVIELELENMTIFLVHLALSFRIRHHQLSHLYDLVKGARRPLMVAGDFNAFWGEKEIHLFLEATGLTKAGATEMPTFPSWAPTRSLDFILHSREINVSRIEAPPVVFSDHLPVICDFTFNS